MFVNLIVIGLVVFICIAIVLRVIWPKLRARDEIRSIHHHSDAMERLRSYSEHDPSAESTSPNIESSNSCSPKASTGAAHLKDKSAMSTDGAPWAAGVAARVIGLDDPPGGRDPLVEANARLTGTTGLVLIVLLFLEGMTIPFIGRLVSWHILIGLALLPPLVIKMVSVLWRFSRYYLHDPRYRRAGPPHPLLRVLGPFVMISTIVLFGTGIALWILGPTDRTMFRMHQLSFVFWFVVVAIHVMAHLLRATHLAAADAKDAKGSPGVGTQPRHRARLRRGLVGASLVLGLLVGFAARSVSSPWTNDQANKPVAHISSLKAAQPHSR